MINELWTDNSNLAAYQIWEGPDLKRLMLINEVPWTELFVLLKSLSSQFLHRAEIPQIERHPSPSGRQSSQSCRPRWSHLQASPIRFARRIQ